MMAPYFIVCKLNISKMAVILDTTSYIDDLHGVKQFLQTLDISKSFKSIVAQLLHV